MHEIAISARIGIPDISAFCQWKAVMPADNKSNRDCAPVKAVTLEFQTGRSDAHSFDELLRAVRHDGRVGLRRIGIGSSIRLALLRAKGSDSPLENTLNSMLVRPRAQPHARVTLAEAIRLVGSKQLKLDHLGLTIGARVLSNFRRGLVFREMARAAEIRLHPGQPDWRFMFLGEFTKFEIAFDETAEPNVVVQLDIQTPHTLEHLRALFPAAVRQDIPVLSDYAVSVPISMGWRSAGLRLDLRAKPTSRQNDFTNWLRANSPRSLRVRPRAS